MSAITPPRATLDDLYRVEGKAELIGGRIVRFMASGHLPSRAAGRIYRSLDEYVEQTGNGFAYADGIGFAVPELPSGRESFSPDASYYLGPLPINPMRFIEGAPQFAVEVRSENDYGPAMDAEYEAKRIDYFQAGTRVVWDVDPLARTVICYRAADPMAPLFFHVGDVADAEPAVPGWRVAVAWIFG
jgi:Uma2 family endonuclease